MPEDITLRLIMCYMITVMAHLLVGGGAMVLDCGAMSGMKIDREKPNETRRE
jgi:hypothetical protein